MTLRYVYGQDKNVAQFVAQLIPHVDYRGFPANATAIGITDARNEPLAGIVYYNWNQRSGTVDIAIAARPTARGWFSRETIRRLYDHAFLGLGCQMVKMQVLASNLSLLRQMHAFGCTLITVPRLYGRDDDGVLCTFTAEAWAQSRFNRTVALQQSEAA
jgi:RimJ/RimL family protein N-acetyltransferase